MTYKHISLDKFPEVFSDTIELSSEVLGGQIVSVSDEFFAQAFHLLVQEPAPSLKGQFGPSGALYSGWESRRHNPSYDWCIMKLGTTGKIVGFDIDTSHFNGNEAPQVSVQTLHGSIHEQPKPDDPRWIEVLPKVDLGPNSRHLFSVAEGSAINHVKLNMYPDGGIARFRVYGYVTPVIPANISEIFDLASVFAGGSVEFTSDQHFGVGANLILPGRGKNMGAGWETKRSREKGHRDWVIIKLGVPGLLEHVEIDTNHFKGNFPESCEIHGCYFNTSPDWEAHEGQDWSLILPRTRLGPHRQHYFQLENVDGKTYTHVMVTIYPDGGIQRVRVMGHKADIEHDKGIIASTAAAPISTPDKDDSMYTSLTRVIPALPLTPEAFAPFGNVIQAYNEAAAAPNGTKVTLANGGSAKKFHKLSLLESSYGSGTQATSGISVYRCQPCNITREGYAELKTLERHPFTNQAFIPLGLGVEEGLKDPRMNYLVVVAQDGTDDKPDLSTLRAFVASAAQGIVYNTAIWHQPMTVLDKAMDLACVETQIGDGSAADCEILELQKGEITRIRLFRE